MKAQIISQTGNAGETELPEFFSIRIREDIAQKFYEAQKKQQPYAPFFMAGKQNSASGNLSHSRRLWKTAYGKGISRVPRKIMWRRGDHFYWIGAEINSARGGRAAHPPRVVHFEKKMKINKKEAVIALQSVIASTAQLEFLKKRYESLENAKISLPIIIKSEILSMKTKEFFNFLEKILQEAWKVALQDKKVRAGRGKMRNRKYKKTRGLLLVTGSNENANFQGIQTRKTEELEIDDFWPMGRLTVYTEQAIKELNKIGKCQEPGTEK